MTVRADREFDAVRPSLLRRWLSPITASAGLLAATTVLLWVWDRPFPHEHLIYIYFVPTALIAIRYGSVSAMGMTIAATVAGGYCFYPPRFTWTLESPLDALELIFFGLLALLASQVVSGFAKDRDGARRRRKGVWARAGR
jgi:K+-sensing histidine kinase KdpD